MKRYTIKPSSVHPDSPIFSNKEKVNGWTIVEREVIDNYDVCLLYYPAKIFDNCDGIYQIGLQQHGLDYNFQNEKLNKIPSHLINVGYISRHKFKKVLRLWIEKYNCIIFSATHGDKMESYHRILNGIGFKTSLIKIHRQKYYTMQ